MKEIIKRANINFKKTTLANFIFQYFKIKSRIIIVLGITLFFSFIFFSFLFYKYSAFEKQDQVKFLAKNLPSYIFPYVNIKLLPGYELSKLQNFAVNNDFDFTAERILKNGKFVTDFWNVDYNSYQLLNIVSSIDGAYFLGTNTQSLDNFARMIFVFVETGLLLLCVYIFTLLISISLSSLVVLNPNKFYSKSIKKIHNLIVLLPLIIISIFIFTLIKFNFLNQLLIFTFFTSVWFFTINTNHMKNISQKKYFTVAKLNGYSKLMLFKHILLPKSLFNILSYIGDQSIIIMSVQVIISFLNINNSGLGLNLGQLILDSLKLVSLNYLYFGFLLSTTLLFLLLPKILFSTIQSSYQGVK